MWTPHLTDGHTCSFPLGNPVYISGKLTFFSIKMFVLPTKLELQNSLFWTHFMSFAQPKTEIDFGFQNTCFLYRFAIKFFWLKTLKKVMDVFRIKFNMNLCKMDKMSKKSEFFKANFMGKTQNFMFQKCPFSQ